MIKLLEDMRVYPAFGREVFFLFLLSVLLFFWYFSVFLKKPGFLKYFYYNDAFGFCLFLCFDAAVRSG